MCAFLSLADWIFTASAVRAQPITGVRLTHMIGWPLREGWTAVSIGLSVLTGLFWLMTAKPDL
ncbi:MAG: DUF2269 family protein [Alphaproteobacteria bacterium]|nr:DUF2269 family protein [Alphaproteobacteria bacterium]